MRMIGSINNLEKGKRFSTYLSLQGIANQSEIKKNTDWGSDDYGNLICYVWIVDEDQVDLATTFLEEFQKSPYDSKFSFTSEIEPKEEKEDTRSKSSEPENSSRWFRRAPQQQRESSKPLGPITLYILIACVWIFIWGRLTAPVFEPFPSYLPPTAVFSPQINKEMLFDYTEKYILADTLIHLYGMEKLNHPEELPSEGKYLISKYLNTPSWQGFYEKILASIREGQNRMKVNAPLFEKVRKGQVWRLFSPCLIHNDIFHLLFNMAWLLILGRQIENRIGIFRYILLMVFAGIFSNTCQYLMSGPNFIGYSGILCAMIVFVWIRQQQYPWEGYSLHPSTMGLIVVFILLMFGIQLVAFFSEIFFGETFTPGIANTAHLSGAAIGYMFAKSKFFSWKARS